MFKNDFGHLNSPFHFQEFDNGVKLYVIPNSGKEMCCSIYVPRFSNTLNNKSDLLCYCVNKLIVSDEFKERYLVSGVLIYFKMFSSYTLFSMIGKSDKVYDACKEILSRISTPFYDEKYLQEQLILNDDEKHLLKINIDNRLLSNMYFISKINSIYVPTEKEIKEIHASTLKKFQTEDYLKSQVCLIFSTPDDPRSCIDKIVNFNYPKINSNFAFKVNTNENYEKVRIKSETIKGNKTYNLLHLGIKFPKREDIFNAYGNDMFYIYDVLKSSVFDDNFYLKTSQLKGNFKLEKSKLIESGEDCALISSFSFNSNVDEFVSFINSYLNNLSKKIEESNYEVVLKKYLARSVSELHNMYSCNTLFASYIPNHIHCQEVISKTVSLKYRTFMKFIDDLKTFKRAFIIKTRKSNV